MCTPVTSGTLAEVCVLGFTEAVLYYLNLVLMCISRLSAEVSQNPKMHSKYWWGYLLNLFVYFDSSFKWSVKKKVSQNDKLVYATLHVSPKNWEIIKVSNNYARIICSVDKNTGISDIMTGKMLKNVENCWNAEKCYSN